MTARSLLSIRLIVPVLALLLGLLTACPASAQGPDTEARLVRDVRFAREVRVDGETQYEPLRNTPVQLFENAVRTEAGKPYRADTIAQDLERLTTLGRSESVTVRVQGNDDGSVSVIFVVEEQPTLLGIRFDRPDDDVDLVDKILFDDDRDRQLLALVLLRVGDPVDKSLIDRGARAIEKFYAEEGHFSATVTYDEKALTDKRELVYKIVQGPSVRISAMRFEGNTVYDDDTLRSQVSSEEYAWPFWSGYLDRTKLDIDVAAIRKYYQDRGYLDVQVGRRIELAPRLHRAVVTFQINEGQQHTVRSVQVQFFKGKIQNGERTEDQLMSEAQIRMVLELVEGGIYSDRRRERSQELIRLWYGEVGFIETDVRIDKLFDPNKPVVDVVVQVGEGLEPTMVDDIVIIGLSRTDQKVLLRRVRLEPGRPANLRALQQTEALVRDSIWFTRGTTTWLGDPEDPARTLLIEAYERNTGSFSIGAGLSSDFGVFGALSLEQKNFDITDWPESFDEFLAQRAFLGAGQTFNITLQPGNEISNYSVGFREPYLFETDYFFDMSASAFQSVREDFDEGRLALRAGVGRRLGDVWTGNARVRLESVNIDSIDRDAPLDVVNVAGESMLTSLGVSLIRSTTDSNITPSRGSRVTFSADQFGALGGDYNFTRFAMGLDQFWTLDEDFLGRKTILSLSLDTGYIPQDQSDVPLFERFYAGGRTMRGWGYRGVGPRGIRRDTLAVGNDPVGGHFQFVGRLQYEFPIYNETLRWVFFSDQGTVQDDFGFDQWRASVGTGVRIKLGFFGQAPIALDFAFPLLEEDGDQSQVFSFSFEVPFN